MLKTFHKIINKLTSIKLASSQNERDEIFSNISPIDNNSLNIGGKFDIFNRYFFYLFFF